MYHAPVYPILHLCPICVVTNLPKSVTRIHRNDNGDSDGDSSE